MTGEILHRESECPATADNGIKMCFCLFYGILSSLFCASQHFMPVPSGVGVLKVSKECLFSEWNLISIIFIL